MKRRKWKPEQKALIVLEGLKGRPIGELCAEHEISQAQYYQWRDQFLAKPRKRSSRPARRNARAGSNARTRGSRPWSASSSWSSKKARRSGVRRGPYAKVAARNAELLERIRELKAEHPSGATAGSGRICATSTAGGQPKARLQRDESGRLLVRPNLKLRARRKPTPGSRGRRATNGGAST